MHISLGDVGLRVTGPEVLERLRYGGRVNVFHPEPAEDVEAADGQVQAFQQRVKVDVEQVRLR